MCSELIELCLHCDPQNRIRLPTIMAAGGDLRQYQSATAIRIYFRRRRVANNLTCTCANIPLSRHSPTVGNRCSSAAAAYLKPPRPLSHARCISFFGYAPFERRVIWSAGGFAHHEGCGETNLLARTVCCLLIDSLQQYLHRTISNFKCGLDYGGYPWLEKVFRC